MSLSHAQKLTTLHAQDARQGIMLGSLRYVLLVSLALAVIAGIILYSSYVL